MLLPGPLIYFFVRGNIKDDYRLSPTDSLHFIPFLLNFIGLIPFYLTPFDQKYEMAIKIIENINLLPSYRINTFFSVQVNYMARPIQMFCYLLVCIYNVWILGPFRNKNVPEQQFIITYRWLLLFLFSYLFLVCTFLLITFDFLQTSVLETAKSLSALHAMAGVFFFLSIVSLLIFPQILYGFPVYHPAPNQVKTQPITDLDDPNNPFNELASQIMAYLLTEKPFLRPDFSQNDLTTALAVPQHHISYCFRVILKKSFPQVKTSMRVNHAKMLLTNAENEHLSFEGIGQKSGFTSRSNFYAAFQAEVGCSPGEFLDQQAKH